MAREPRYPNDAAVGSAAAGAAAAAEPAAEGAGKTGESKRTKRLVTGAAIGIGSAAIVAALLYANRSRKG
jgi:hypothetical protein